MSLRSLGSPGTCSVDQTGLELRDPPASQIQGLKMYALTDQAGFVFICVECLLTRIHVHHVCLWYLKRPEKGSGSPGT